MKKLLALATVVIAAGCGSENTSMPHTDVHADPAEGLYVPPATLRAEQEAKKRIALITVNEFVLGFRSIEKRYPTTLNELVEKGMMRSLPDLPEGFVFTYDPEVGAVGVEERKEAVGTGDTEG